jgi:hypothetical protein
VDDQAVPAIADAGGGVEADHAVRRVRRINWLLLPLQGGGWEGDGDCTRLQPIPTPALPLKGRELVPSPCTWK